ncbi:oligosaccharide flippase family protein [Acinetobacter bohemicus]|uniref:Membrane protein involved in the export of O-antigen and teichoic acid n=1 Tax=Acinetobacter bohemicus TaxID=1435036 RepID=A0A1I6TAY9_9GAMM|nr:oligosaccharide flippase family protein [Acinetobacter bohemicus]KAB0652767.1 oligosaccharide flippase family protein [Acinetobacter bohemicus]SFS86376.1 Membrane protein involved in the export of O-antigen and teichoic acid [Acinetobacter bohemicus]
MKDILLLLKKAKWLVGGNFIFAFSQWVILIFFARMTNQENLGQYALALAIVTPIFAVGNLQLRPLYILDVNSEQKYTYTHFYYLRLICSFIALACCLVLGLFFNVSILVLLLVGLLKFFESYSDIIYAYYNAHDQTQLISKSLFLKGTLSVLAVAVALYLFDFYTALILFLIVYLVVWLFIDNLYIQKTQEIKKMSLDLGIMKSAIPMGISLGIVTLQSNIPRLFLDQYASIEAVGIFTVLSYFIIVGSIFINSICQYLSPRLTHAWNHNRAYFKKLLFMALLVAGGLGLIAIFLSYFMGEFVLKLVYGAEYIAYADAFVLTMVAGFILYLATVLGYTLTAIGFIKQQVYLFSIVLIFSVLVSYLCIPEYGIIGGIYTLMVSYLVQCVLSLLVVLFRLKE